MLGPEHCDSRSFTKMLMDKISLELCAMTARSINAEHFKRVAESVIAEFGGEGEIPCSAFAVLDSMLEHEMEVIVRHTVDVIELTKKTTAELAHFGHRLSQTHVDTIQAFSLASSLAAARVCDMQRTVRSACQKEN